MVVLVQQVGLLCDVKHAHHTVTWIHHMGVWLSIWRQCCLHYRNRPMQRNHTPNQPTTGKGKLWMQNSLRTQKVISRWVLVECFPNPSKTQWICNAGSKFSISHILQLTLTATHVCFFLFKSKYWISLSGDFFVKNVPEVFFEPFTLDLFQDLSQLQEIWIAEGEKYLKVSQKYFGVELRGIIMCLSHESIWSFFFVGMSLVFVLPLGFTFCVSLPNLHLYLDLLGNVSIRFCVFKDKQQIIWDLERYGKNCSSDCSIFWWNNRQQS